MDGELHHTGWVKLELEMLPEDVETFFGKKKLLAVSLNKALHFRKFLFFSETSL